MPGVDVLDRGREVSPQSLRDRADWIRLRVIELIDGAGLGHYSSSFSCAEILTVLYYQAMRLNPSDPSWQERDRFLLGKGHAAVALWPVLSDLGYFPPDELDRFGDIGSPMNDHPDMLTAPGCDFSSGSLGHNLSVGVGMALGGRLRGSDFRTFVLTGDGELNEGQVWEAAMAAAHFRLGNLVAIVDANGFCGSGETAATMNPEPVLDKFRAFGWDALAVDGHDVEALMQTLDRLPDPSGERPTCILARTVKGRGVAAMEANPQAWHIGCMTPAQRDAAVEEISTRMQEVVA